jgi:hypothetical protein
VTVSRSIPAGALPSVLKTAPAYSRFARKCIGNKHVAESSNVTKVEPIGPLTTISKSQNTASRKT